MKLFILSSLTALVWSLLLSSSLDDKFAPFYNEFGKEHLFKIDESDKKSTYISCLAQKYLAARKLWD